MVKFENGNNLKKLNELAEDICPALGLTFVLNEDDPRKFIGNILMTNVMDFPSAEICKSADRYLLTKKIKELLGDLITMLSTSLEDVK